MLSSAQGHRALGMVALAWGPAVCRDGTHHDKGMEVTSATATDAATTVATHVASLHPPRPPLALVPCTSEGRWQRWHFVEGLRPGRGMQTAGRGLCCCCAPVQLPDVIVLMAIGSGFTALAAPIHSFLPAPSLLPAALRMAGHADGTRGDGRPRCSQPPLPAGLCEHPPCTSHPGQRLLCASTRLPQSLEVKGSAQRRSPSLAPFHRWGN